MILAPFLSSATPRCQVTRVRAPSPHPLRLGLAEPVRTTDTSSAARRISVRHEAGCRIARSRIQFPCCLVPEDGRVSLILLCAVSCPAGLSCENVIAGRCAKAINVTRRCCCAPIEPGTGTADNAFSHATLRDCGSSARRLRTGPLLHRLPDPQRPPSRHGRGLAHGAARRGSARKL